MEKQIVRDGYTPPTNVLSNLVFEGGGMIHFLWDELIIDSCDLSIFFHIPFHTIKFVEVDGDMTMDNLEIIAQCTTQCIVSLTIHVDECSYTTILQLFKMFEFVSIEIQSWKSSDVDIILPNFVEEVICEDIACSNIKRLFTNHVDLFLNNVSFDCDVDLGNIKSDIIYFQECLFLGNLIGFYENVVNFTFYDCQFQGNYRLKLPKTLKFLDMSSNEGLEFEMFEFHQCRLQRFQFSETPETPSEFPNFNDLGPIFADEKKGIDVHISSYRIESISNLKIVGNINSIGFVYFDQNVRMFTDLVDQFKPFNLGICINPDFRVANELMNHFQNAHLHFVLNVHSLPEELVRGQLFQQYLPLLTRFANHRVRKNLMILNQGHIMRNRISAIRKLPRELRMMLGSFLMFTPNILSTFNQVKLNHLFGNNIIRQLRQ